MAKMFNRICLLATTVLLMTFMCKSSAAAKDITVSGQDIQGALNEAINSNEETIVTIPAGTYNLNSSLLVYSNTTIRAEGAQITVNNGQPALTVSQYIEPANIRVYGGTWRADGAGSVIDFPGRQPNRDISLENMTIYGDKNAKGIYLNAVTGGKVSRCVIENTSIGIDLSWCNQIEVSGNTTTATAETGFQATKVENLTVSDNKFLGNGKYGILADWAVSSTISKNILDGCALDPNRAGHGEGLVVRNSEGIWVNGNEVYNVQSHIANWGIGILVASSKDITVQGNTVDHAGNHGIQATYGSDRVYLNDNIVNNSGNIGISISRATRADISGGAINNTTGSAIVYDGHETWDGKTAVSGTVTGCVIDGSTASGIYITQADITVKNTTVKNSTSMGVVVQNGTAALYNSVIRQDEVDPDANGIVATAGARITLEGNRICNFGNSGIVNNPGCVVTGSNNQIMVNANRFKSNSVYNPEGGASAKIKNNTLLIKTISGTDLVGQIYWTDFECGAVVNGIKYGTKSGGGGLFSVSYPQTDSSRVIVYAMDEAGNATILQAPPDFDLNKLQTGDVKLVEDFVKRMYRITLGREADADGVKYYVDRLQSGVMDGSAVAQGFVGSPEFQGKNLSADEYLSALYSAFFDRTASSADIQYWKEKMSSGMSRKYVLQGFVNSPEFEKLCSDAGISRGLMVLEEGEEYEVDLEKLGDFVERLYVKALQRAAELDGKRYYVEAISSRQITPEQAAKNFFFSAEFEGFRTSDAEYIRRLYETFMGRSNETDGMNYWLDQMSRGMSRETVLSRFAASDEFKGIMREFGIR